PADSGRRHLKMADCDLPTISQVLDALRQRAGKTPPGQWVLGFLYDDSKTEHSLTIRELDSAFPDHPMLVYHRGGHTGFANSLAFKAAKVDAQTPDPQGGHFDHDSTGQLTGFVADAALHVLDRVIDSKTSPEEQRAAVKLITKMMASKGITSMGDAAATTEDLRAYQDAHAAGDLLARVYSNMFVDFLDPMMAAGIHT